MFIKSHHPSIVTVLVSEVRKGGSGALTLQPRPQTLVLVQHPFLCLGTGHLCSGRVSCTLLIPGPCAGRVGLRPGRLPIQDAAVWGEGPGALVRPSGWDGHQVPRQTDGLSIVAPVRRTLICVLCGRAQEGAWMGTSFLHKCTHTYSQTLIHFTLTHIHIHIHKLTHMQSHTHSHILTHTLLHIHALSCTHTYAHPQIQHPHTQKHIHTYSHTFTEHTSPSPPQRKPWLVHCWLFLLLLMHYTLGSSGIKTVTPYLKQIRGAKTWQNWVLQTLEKTNMPFNR